MPDMGNIRIKDENMNKTTIITNVQTRLFELQDLKYRDFHAKLMPTVNKEKIIGVRTPALRVFAKKYGKTDEAKEYLQILPHQYYEENNLHGLLIEQIKDYTLGYKLPGAGGGGYLYMVAKDPQAAGCIRRILTEQAPNPRARFVEMTLSDKGLQVSRS